MLLKKYFIPLLIGIIFCLNFFTILNFTGYFQDGYLYASFGRHAAELGRWLIPYHSENSYSEFHHHTPFIFILEGLFFKLFGFSYNLGRIFSITFIALTTILIYNFALKKGPLFAFISCLIFLSIKPLIIISEEPNLEGPLLFFSFCSFYLFFEAIHKNRPKEWITGGLFFGLTLLTKGPMGLFIPLSVFFYIILSKKTSLFSQKIFWISWIMGFFIFSIWPISLLFYGKFEVFESWFHFTFIHTIFRGRGQNYNDYLYYFKFFANYLKYLNIFFFLSISYLLIKRKLNDFEKYIASILLIIFSGLSICTHKYAHYITLIFPFYSLLSSLFFENVLMLFKKQFFRFSIPFFSCLLLALPIKIKTQDEAIFLLFKKMDEKRILVNDWAIVQGAYEYWTLNNLIGLENRGKVHLVSLNDFYFFLNSKIPLPNKNWIFLVPSRLNIKNDKINKIFEYPQKKLSVYVLN